MSNEHLRIAVIGSQWFGSSAAGVAGGFRQLNHEVHTLDPTNTIPDFRNRRLRALRAVAMPVLVTEFNRRIINLVEELNPHFVLACKGSWIKRETVLKTQRLGVPFYNYYPDPSLTLHDVYLKEAATAYTHIFTTKSFHMGKLSQEIPIRSLSFLHHGYSSDVHRPMPLASSDLPRIGADVSLVGSFSLQKQQWLSAIKRSVPHATMRIWGRGWEACGDPLLTDSIMGRGVLGSAYAKVVTATKINLGLMHGVHSKANEKDNVSTRSFEIPAIGGFMLHERNDEIRDLYEEDLEAAFFDTPEELAQQVRRFLADDESRARIANAGHRRCVPAYSYDERVKGIISHYIAHHHQGA